MERKRQPGNRSKFPAFGNEPSRAVVYRSVDNRCPADDLRQGAEIRLPRKIGNDKAAKRQLLFSELTENQIAKIVVDAAYRIHKHFGPGLHETVYEVCLLYELKKCGSTITSPKSSSLRLGVLARSTLPSKAWPKYDAPLIRDGIV